MTVFLQLMQRRNCRRRGGAAAVGAMQEPRLAMPPELIRKRAVVAEQCVVVEAAITVLGTTTGTGVLTA